MSNPADSKSYYESLKMKWETDYPSSSSIEEVWAFYEECGYEDPVACFTRIPICSHNTICQCVISE